MPETQNQYRKAYWLIDLLGALACGYLIGAFQQKMADSGEYIPENFYRCVLLAVCSYSLVALLLPTWKSRPLRRVPNWVLILLLGSAIFYFCVHLVDTVTYAIRFRYTQPGLGTAEYVLSYVWDFGVGLFFVSLMDSILASPLMVAVHFLGTLLIRARRL